jgi:hypothetical protein
MAISAMTISTSPLFTVSMRLHVSHFKAYAESLRDFSGYVYANYLSVFYILIRRPIG